MHNIYLVTDVPHLHLDAQLCFALHATSRAMVQAYEPHLRKMGITYPQYLVLLVLWEEGTVKVGRLGERLLLDSGTLTPLLKRMATQGLLERRRDDADERVVLVSLTPRGRALQKQAQTLPESLLCAMDLSVAQATELRGRLHRLLRSLRNANPKEESP